LASVASLQGQSTHAELAAFVATGHSAKSEVAVEVLAANGCANLTFNAIRARSYADSRVGYALCAVKI